MILTRENLHAAGRGVLGNAGWNRAQVELLGVSWPPAKGWLSKLVGTSIPDATYRQLVALRTKPRSLSRKLAVKRDTTPDMFGTDTPESFANDMYEADRDAFS